MSHELRMLIGCVLPVLALFLLPVLGIGGGAAVLVAIVLMFACHLLMTRGHGHGRRPGDTRTGHRHEGGSHAED